MIKIDVISGFLGAGKTTLIKKLFESSIKNEKVVIIENEFGEIGIDSSFLKQSGIEIKEINAGCICCSLVGDFASSIKELIEKYNPERIIIEPSGVGKLSDIISAINDLHSDNLKLNILATVVDGKKAKIYMKNFGEFFNNQIQSAQSIIISKLDLIDNKKVDQVIELVKTLNNSANIITTPLKDLNGQVLLNTLESSISLKDDFISEVMKLAEDDKNHHHEDEECCCEHHHGEHHHHEDEECCCKHHHGEHHHHEDEECCCEYHHGEHHHHEDEECCCEHHHGEHHHHEDKECCCEHHHGHHHHHADEVFTSWGKETAIAVTYDHLNRFLKSLDNEQLGIILRSKGIIKAADNDKWYHFDYVSGDYEIRLGEPDYTGRIVVIGSSLDEDKIESLFFGE